MFDTALRYIPIVVAVLMLAACEKSDGNKSGASLATASGAAAPAPARVYGKEDAECFAGIVRTTDAKHVSQDDFKKWKDKLADKDKEWLSGFSVFYSGVTRVITTHMGKTNQELYDAKLINKEQLGVIEGYLAVAQEADAAKADSLAASACASIGFSKGLNFN